MQARKCFSLLVASAVIAVFSAGSHADDGAQAPLAPLAQIAVPQTFVMPAASDPATSATLPAQVFVMPRAADVAESSATPAAASPAPDGFGVAMTANQLDAQRGGDAVIGQNYLTGDVASNTASRVETGSNTITEGSFANASGLPTVIQNTGANVLIQNATVLNVRFGN